MTNNIRASLKTYDVRQNAQMNAVFVVAKPCQTQSMPVVLRLPRFLEMP